MCQGLLGYSEYKRHGLHVLYINKAIKSNRAVSKTTPSVVQSLAYSPSF